MSRESGDDSNRQKGDTTNLPTRPSELEKTPEPFASEDVGTPTGQKEKKTPQQPQHPLDDLFDALQTARQQGQRSPSKAFSPIKGTTSPFSSQKASLMTVLVVLLAGTTWGFYNLFEAIDPKQDIKLPSPSSKAEKQKSVTRSTPPPRPVYPNIKKQPARPKPTPPRRPSPVRRVVTPTPSFVPPPSPEKNDAKRLDARPRSSDDEKLDPLGLSKEETVEDPELEEDTEDEEVGDEEEFSEDEEYEDEDERIDEYEDEETVEDEFVD